MSIVESYRSPCHIAETVIQGPIVPGNDAFDEAVFLDQLPFAYRLLMCLIKEGAIITFEAGTKKHGEACVSVAGLIGFWNQFNVRKDLPEQLGSAILAHCGKNITFGELWMPNKGVEYAAVCRADAVFVRHLVAYQVATDDFRQRWDVLVRAT